MVLDVRQLAVDAVLVVLRGESASGELILDPMGVVGIADGRPLSVWRSVDFADTLLGVGLSRQGEVLLGGTRGDSGPGPAVFLRFPYLFSLPESRLSLETPESACKEGRDLPQAPIASSSSKSCRLRKLGHCRRLIQKKNDTCCVRI